MYQHQDIRFTLDSAFAKVSSHKNIQRQQAQSQLFRLRQIKQYPISLLDYIQQSNSAQNQLRCAIEIKLWFTKYKDLEQYQCDQYDFVIEEFKNRIISIYLIVPDKMAQQILQAIVNLAQKDFPDRWMNLIKQLISRIEQISSTNTLRILRVIKKITDKYSYMLRSDPLYKQIIMVCNQVHDFLLKITQTLLSQLQNKAIEKLSYSILKQILKLYYNLNYQDLHPLFQDNIQNWMSILTYVMRINNHDQIVFQCKGQALRCLLLFASKYLDDVSSYIQEFSKEIWNLCGITNQDPQFDNIVLNALKYFKNLVVWQNMRPFFSNNLPTLLSKLIIPNTRINSNVIQTFETEPTLFIDVYFQNSDINTRRSAAIDLVKSIARNYNNFQQFLQGFLLEYKGILQTMGRNLEQESILLNLVIDSGTIAYRSMDGVTQISINADIILYIYQEIIKPYFAIVYGWILKNQGKAIDQQYNLIHLAMQLRFIYYFRLYIPKQDLILIVKFCSSLSTQSKTFKNIIYLVLEGFLEIRHGNFTLYKDLVPYFNPNSLDELAFDILKTIYYNENKQQELNRYLTKTLFSLCKGLKQNTVKYSQQLRVIINSMLSKTQSYDFKSVIYLFQTLSFLAYWTLINDQKNISPIQLQLQIYYKKIFMKGSDLLNFIFQIYSMIVLLRKSQIPSTYALLYKSIISLKTWSQQNSSLFSAYTQYLVTYLSKNPQLIISDKSSLQVILTQLVNINFHTYFINLLTELYNIMGIQGFYNTGYLLIFIQGIGALNNPDTRTAVLKLSIIFFCNMMIKQDINKVIAYTNNISQNFIENLFCEGISIISSIQLREQKRIIFYTVCNMLSINCLSSLEKWGILLNSLVQNTQRKFTRMRAKPSEVVTTNLDGTFQKLSIWNQLKKQIKSPIADEEQYLVQSFNKIYNQINDQINIGNFLTESNQKQLTNLIKKYS